jgi:hypothetical protein
MGLTAADLKALSQDYLDLAQALLAYRTSYPISDQTQRNNFNDVFSQVVVTADNLENQAVTAALANISTSAQSLGVGVQSAAAAVKRIAEVTGVIKVVTAAVGLGTAILNPTPAGVASALSNLVQAIHPEAASGGSIGGAGSPTAGS